MSAVPQLKLPMYYRIQQTLLEQIQNGQLHHGTLLPSEAELAQQYQVSRITAKRALDELVRQGRAYRQQGRGTFVAQPRIREITGFRSFSEDILARGFTPSSRILDFKEIAPESTIQARLRLPEGEKAILLKRLRLADKEPVAIETAYLPSNLCPGLLQEDLSGNSLYTLLREKYQLIPTWGDAEIEAAPAAKAEARLLNITGGTPVLIARRVTFAANYQGIETVESIYRGDRFTFYTGRQFIE